MQGKENANPNHPYLHCTPKPNRPTCRTHNEEVGRFFCEQCLSYNLCAKCCPDHQGHPIRKFQNASQAKEQTKEVLLVEVEHTLNRLKGRENELKNQSEEISLIKQNLKALSDDVIATIKQQLDQLERKI
jgi:hypothetical protein